MICWYLSKILSLWSFKLKNGFAWPRSKPGMLKYLLSSDSLTSLVRLGIFALEYLFWNICLKYLQTWDVEIFAQLQQFGRPRQAWNICFVIFALEYLLGIFSNLGCWNICSTPTVWPPSSGLEYLLCNICFGIFALEYFIWNIWFGIFALEYLLWNICLEYLQTLDVEISPQLQQFDRPHQAWRGRRGVHPQSLTPVYFFPWWWYCLRLFNIFRYSKWNVCWKSWLAKPHHLWWRWSAYHL